MHPRGGISMKTGFLASICIVLLFNQACQKSSSGNRKIRLSDQQTQTRTDDQLTTTIHLEPTLRRAIAVMFFDNQTGDQNLEWLQKGLTEMFIRSLSQSRSLSVLSVDRMYEIFKRLGKTEPEEVDVDMAAVVAKEANVEAVLTGHITKIGDSLRIDVVVRESNQGQIIKRESVEGVGLENIFSMVDHLTQNIKNDLQLSGDKDEPGRSIADLSTNSLEAWRSYTSGVDLMNQFRWSESIEQYKRATALDSTFVSAYFYLTNLLYNQGQIEQGYDAYQRLLSLRDKAIPREKFMIDLLDAGIQNNPSRQIEVSREWIKQYPEDRDANFTLATVHYNLQYYDRAILVLKKVLEIDPNYALAHNQLGYTYANMGDYTNAVVHLNQYKELNPDEPNPYDSLGEIYLYQGNYKHAEKYFKEAFKVNENFLFAWQHLGNTYIDRGNYGKALDAFNTSLKKSTDPSDKANALSQIGLTQWRLGHTEEAIDSYHKALEHVGYRYLTMTWLHEVYQSKNDSIGGIHSLKQNYESVKQLVDTYPNLIRTLANLSLWYDVNVDETISIINSILKTTDNPYAKTWGRFLLGLLYLKTNQYDEYAKLSDAFAIEWLDAIKDIPDIQYTYSTWRVFSIFNQYAYQAPEEGIQKYDRLIRFCIQNELKIPEMVLRSYLADVLFHTGDREKGLEQLKISGVPEEQKWMVIGPFDHKNGFNKKYPTEKRTDITKTDADKSQPISWQHANDGIEDGYIDLQQIFKKYNWSVAYGLIYMKPLI